MPKAKNQLKFTSFLALTIAGIINALGVTIFLYPVALYDSGFSGTAMLFSQLFPDYLSLSLMLILLNVPIFLFGLKRQGLAFTIYSVYVVGIYSLGAWLITNMLPIDLSFASPLAGTDLLLCAMFGGMISGLGSGVAIRFGGAMDGIEVLSVIFAKKLGITVGTFCMVYNVILYVICGIILKSWILPLYSIITYMSALRVVDFITEGVSRSKSALIITTKPNEISEALSQNFQCGVTLMDAKGGFSGEKKTMIYFVVNRFQVSKMKDMVREIDESAYITISEVADVFRTSQ